MTDETNPSPESQTFAEALAESFAAEQLEVGQLISGHVMAVVGDVVVNVSPELRVSRRQAQERREREALRGAYANGIPVEGEVSGRNKGGYDVSIAGVRAFCPMSQIDLGFPRNVDAFLGIADPQIGGQ